MGALLRGLAVLALLSVPLLVVMSLPSLFELAASLPAAPSRAAPAAAPLRLVEPEPTLRPNRFVPLEPTPPPTLAGLARTSTPRPADAQARATPTPTPTGERVIVTNTGGRGAVLRTEPVSGRPVAALRDEQVVVVLQHQTVPGGGEWLRVRTADGLEGWVTGLVLRPAPSGR